MKIDKKTIGQVYSAQQSSPAIAPHEGGIITLEINIRKMPPFWGTGMCSGRLKVKERKKEAAMRRTVLLKLRAEVARSLARSRLRIEVLCHLTDIHPKRSYISEIARVTGGCRNNIRGALRGGRRYSSSGSLIHLRLVETIREDGRRYYRATEKGVEIGKMLKTW